MAHDYYAAYKTYRCVVIQVGSILHVLIIEGAVGHGTTTVWNHHCLVAMQLAPFRAGPVGVVVHPAALECLLHVVYLCLVCTINSILVDHSLYCGLHI